MMSWESRDGPMGTTGHPTFFSVTRTVELMLSQVTGLELAHRDTEMLSHLTLQNQIFPNIGNAEGFIFYFFFLLHWYVREWLRSCDLSVIPRLPYQLAFAFRECDMSGEVVKTEVGVGAGRGERMGSCPASGRSSSSGCVFSMLGPIRLQLGRRPSGSALLSSGPGGGLCLLSLLSLIHRPQNCPVWHPVFHHLCN